MPTVVYLKHDGSSEEIHVENGTSVMQGAVDNMIDGILGDCGGTCSCATCHCYVDEAWLGKTGSPGDMEKDLLTCVLNPEENSRLSCQIIMSDDLDGLVVNLPKSQF